MPLTRRFCTQCGKKVETKLVEGEEREVCTVCNTVFYQNPLPVAAAVVINEKREVLLIKRGNEPQKGMWCLPTGFAEVGETISQAALRELREETGIGGRVVRLLTAESSRSDFYGDLLIIGFEVKKIEGKEAPGDDAVEVAYFNLEELPTLAFSAHLKTIGICAEHRKEEWSIQDSFKHLRSNTGEAMISDALVRLVENQAKEISGRWTEVVRRNSTTPTYGQMDKEEVCNKAMVALSKFCLWLKSDEASGEIGDFYRKLGAERKAQGFTAHEVLSALTLLRKEVWFFARDYRVLESPRDVYGAMELSNRVVLFFDKALYHTMRGYREST